jgi:VWFA-related protein
MLSVAWLLMLMMMIGYSVQAQSKAEGPPPDLDVISTDTSLVTINVSVRDHKNRQLSGLKLEDFHVTDQGKIVRPEFVDTLGPVSIVFVMDVSSSMGGHWQELRAGLKKFLAKEHDGSDYTLVTFNEEAQLVTSSTDAKRFWESFKTLRPYGETALYDGLLLGLEMLERVPQRHKALVLLSDGEDNNSKAELEMVERQTLRHRATIYSVGILYEREDGKRLLNQLAAATGGLVHFPQSSKLPAVLDSIRADLSNQYSLSYYPPEKTPGWHRVEVDIAQSTSRLNLRYQQRYQMR